MDSLLDPHKLIPTTELIRLALSEGLYVGSGDPTNYIRYLTKVGLLPPARRLGFNGGNYTVGHFPKSSLDTLRQISALVKAGWTIQQIVDQGTPTDIPTTELISKAQLQGIYLGSGDPVNYIRYLTKLGILPNAQRQSVSGSANTVGHYPVTVLETLKEVERRLRGGETIQQIAQSEGNASWFVNDLAKPESIKPELISHPVSNQSIQSDNRQIVNVQNALSKRSWLPAKPVLVAAAVVLGVGVLVMSIPIYLSGRGAGELSQQVLTTMNLIPATGSTTLDAQTSYKQESDQNFRLKMVEDTTRAVALAAQDLSTQNQSVKDIALEARATANAGVSSIDTTAQNEIQNSSFELNNSGQPDAWQYINLSDSTNTFVSQDCSRTGQNAIKFVLTGVSAGGIKQSQTLTRSEVDPALSAWVKGIGLSSNGYIRIGLKDANGKFVSKQDYYLSGTFDWQRLTLSASVVGAYPAIEFKGYTKGTACVDDWQVTEGSVQVRYNQTNLLAQGTISASGHAELAPVVNGKGSLGTPLNRFGALYLTAASIDKSGNMSISGTITSAAIQPSAAHTYDIGTAAVPYRTVYADNIVTGGGGSSGDLNVVGNLTVSGTSQLNGNVTIGNNLFAPPVGTVGYWSRSGTTLTPSNSGDNVSTTGSITGATLTTTGTASIGGTLTVTGATTLNNSLNVSGLSTLADLISSGQIKLTGNTADRLLIQPAVDPGVSTKLFEIKNAGGAEQVSLSSDGKLHIVGAETIDGASTIAGLLSANGGIVTNNASINAGSGAISGGAISGATLTTTGNASVGANLLLPNAGGSAITPSGALTIGATGQNLTLQGATTQVTQTTGGFTSTLNFLAPTAARTVSVPNESGTICLQGSTACGFAPGGAGTYLAKNAHDTSSASFLGNLYDFTNTNAGAAGVLSLTNSGTNSALSVSQSANPTAGQALITANNTNGAPSGNLLDLQSGGVSKFSVSSAGLTTTAGNLSFSGAAPNISASTANTNLTVNANGTGTITLGSTSTGNIGFYNVANNFLTSAGNFTLAGDITLTAGGTIASTANSPIVLDAGSGAVKIGVNGTGKLTVGILDPYIVSNTGTVQSALEFQTTATAGADDFVFEPAGTEKIRFTEAGNISFTGVSPSISLATINATLNLDANGSGVINIGSVSTGDVSLAGGSGATGCTVTNSNGNFTCSGSILGSSSGTVGYWTRTGTTLAPATAGDNVTTSGNISTSGSGTITSAGLLTGSNGLTLTTGALNLTSTSGSAGLTLSSSTTAFNINSGLFDIDTTNSRVGIGTTAPSQKLELFNGNSLHNIATARFTPQTAPGAPTAADSGLAGNLNGTYTWKITFVTASGETEGGTTSNSLTLTNHSVNLTAIPTGTSGVVTYRKIYRTKAGGTSYFLVTALGNNTATTFTDNVADASLVTAMPLYNTTDSILATTNNFVIQHPAGKSVVIGDGLSNSKLTVGILDPYQITNQGTVQSQLEFLTTNTGGTDDFVFEPRGIEKMRLTAAGNLSVSGTVTASGINNTSGQFLANSGTQGAPSYAFTSSTGAGIYLPATNQIGIATSGTEKLRIDASGNVGIGTTSPSSFKLQTAGNIGPDANNSYDLGSATLAFRTAYLATSEVFKGTSFNTTLGFVQPTVARTINLPDEGGTVCLQNSANCGFVTSGSGTFLAKNAHDTSSASYVGNLYDLTNTSTGAAGVLSLTNSGTNSALSITQSGNPSAGQALILANNSNGTPTGNLLDLQTGGTSKLSVSSAGNVTLGGTAPKIATVSNTDLIIDAGTGAVKIGATGTGKLTVGVLDPYLITNTGVTQGALEFRTSATAGADDFVFETAGTTERVRIFEGGNVNLVSGDIQTAGTSRLTNAGVLQSISGYTQTSGNFTAAGSTGTFDTSTGVVGLNGDTTLAANKNLTIAAGTGTLTQTFQNSGSNAVFLNVTNTGSSGSNTVHAARIALTGTVNGTGTNVINGLFFTNISPLANNSFYALNLGTGFTDALRVGGTQIIDGTGILQSAGFSGTYSNAVTLSNGTNTITTNNLTATGGTINGTTIGATTPSTGSFTTLAASGLASLNGGASITCTGCITDANVVDALTINGGTINNTPIGATTPSTGAFSTLSASGLISANGGLTLAANQNLTLSSGTGTYSQTYVNTGGDAVFLNVTNSASSGSTTVNAQRIALTGTANGTGTNTINGVLFPNITPVANNSFYALNLGTGFTDALRVGGTQIINGSGVVQSAGLSGTYSNALTLSSTANVITAGTLTALGGTINATSVGQTTAAAGSFTSLSASSNATLSGGATITCTGCITDANVVDALTINGGTINNTPVGATTTSTGAFTTLSASGLISANGGITLAANQNLTFTAGTGSETQTYTNSGGDAKFLNVTNSASSGTTTVNATRIALTGTANGTGSNTINALLIPNITTQTNNTFNGLNFGTGLNSALLVGGTQIINGTGVLQSAGLSGTYSNALTLSSSSNSITAGTLTATGGTINGTSVGATTASTGAFTSLSATGLATLSGGATITCTGCITDANVVDALTINGGTINNTPIGATTTSTGAFTTLSASGLISANGGLTLAANQNLTLSSGTGQFSLTYVNNAGNAATINVTDNASSGSTTVNAISVPLTGTANGTGSNTINAIFLPNVTAATNNSFNALNFGTGYTNFLTSGTISISSAGTVSTPGNISTTGTGAITSAGLLTASNGLTLTTGTLTFSSATPVSLASSATALNFASGLLDLDTLNGRVGIGTAAPGVALDVSRTSADSFIRSQTTTSGNAALELLTNGNQQYDFLADRANNYLLIKSSVFNFLTLAAATGNVGIGTTGPGAKLEVSGTAVGNASTLKLTDTGASGKTYQLGEVVTAGNFEIYDTAVGSRLAIQGSSGNIGIGNTNYNAKLDVNGSVLVPNNTYYQARNAANSANISILKVDTGNNTVLDSPSTGLLSLATTGTERVRITDSTLNFNSLLYANSGTGFVGVGTTAPNSVLELNGAGAASVGTALLTLNNTHGTSADEVGINFTNFTTCCTTGNYAGTARINSYLDSGGATAQLRFYTGGATPGTRLTIDGTGNVGIGTTAPGVLLELGTNTGPTGYIRLRGATTLEGNIYHDTTYSLHLDTNGNSTPIRIDGSAIHLMPTGNVGIGTTAPLSKLDVLSSGTANTVGDAFGVVGNFTGPTQTGQNSSLSIDSNDAVAIDTGGVLGFGGRYSGTAYANWASIKGLKADGTAGNYGGYLSFFTRTTGFASAERMRIDTSGNVGIGTSPGYKLDISGTLNATGLIYGNGKEMFNTGDSYLRFNQSGAFSSGIWTANSNILNGSGYLGLGSNGGTTTSSTYLVGSYTGTNLIKIDSSASSATSYFNAGNFGIGYTSPNTKLHINGGEGVNGLISATSTLNSAELDQYVPGNGFSYGNNMTLTSSGSTAGTHTADGKFIFNNANNAWTGGFVSATSYARLADRILEFTVDTSAAGVSTAQADHMMVGWGSGTLGSPNSYSTITHAVYFNKPVSGAYDLSVYEDGTSRGALSGSSVVWGDVVHIRIILKATGANYYYKINNGKWRLGYTGTYSTGTPLYPTIAPYAGRWTIHTMHVYDADTTISLDSGVVNTSGNLVVGSGGTGKITVTTFDPLYNIGGVRYSTYSPSMIGVHEEITGTVTTAYDPTKGVYSSVVDIGGASNGSDLWVFGRVTDPNLSLTSVLVSGGNGKSWYVKDPSSRKITIYSDRGGEVSYRLTAPRFDHLDWTTLSSDQQTEGYHVPDSVVTTQPGSGSLGEDINSGAYSENYQTTDGSIARGDVVSVSKTAASPTVVKSAGGYDARVLGVAITNSAGVVSVAPAGRASVKVSVENGVISSGDHLTSSATKLGVAMKSTQAGRTLGVALQGISSDGLILVAVSPSWFDPNAVVYNPNGTPSGTATTSTGTFTTLTATTGTITTANITNLNIGGVAIFTDASGNLKVNGNVIVAGNVQLTDLRVNGILSLNGVISAPYGVQVQLGGAKEFQVTDATGSAKLRITDQGEVAGKSVAVEEVRIATSSATLTAATTTTPDTYDYGSATVGSGTFKAGATALVLKTTKVATGSKIFVSFSGNYAPATRYWTGEVTSGVSFNLHLDLAPVADTAFSWWIVN